MLSAPVEFNIKKSAGTEVGNDADLAELKPRQLKIIEDFKKTGLAELYLLQKSFPELWTKLLQRVKYTEHAPDGLLDWVISINERNFSATPMTELYEKFPKESSKKEVALVTDGEEENIEEKYVDIFDTVLNYLKMAEQKWKEEPYQHEARVKDKTFDRMRHFTGKIEKNKKWTKEKDHCLQRTREVYDDMKVVNEICDIVALSEEPVRIGDAVSQSRLARILDQLNNKLARLNVKADEHKPAGISVEQKPLWEEIQKLYEELKGFEQNYKKEVETHSLELRKRLEYLAEFCKNCSELLREAISENADIWDDAKVAKIKEAMSNCFVEIGKAGDKIIEYQKAGKVLELGIEDLLRDFNEIFNKLIELLGQEFTAREYKKIADLFGYNFFGYDRVESLWHEKQKSGGNATAGKTLFDFIIRPGVYPIIRALKLGKLDSKQYALTCDLPGISLDTPLARKPKNFPSNGYRSTLSSVLHPNNMRHAATKRMSWRIVDTDKKEQDLLPIQAIQDMMIAAQTFGLGKNNKFMNVTIPSPETGVKDNKLVLKILTGVKWRSDLIDLRSGQRDLFSVNGRCYNSVGEDLAVNELSDGICVSNAKDDRGFLHDDSKFRRD